MPMTNAQARLRVDPVLSTLAHGYKNPEFIAEKLFPLVTCPSRGVKVIKFGKEAFIRHKARRAPGADTQRVMFGYHDTAVKLHQEALEAVVPREWSEESAAVPVDVSQMAVNLVIDNILLGAEIDAAAIAQDPDNYGVDNKETLTAGNYWDDPDADLKAQVKNARAVVRRKIGRNPNVLVLPNDVFESAKNNKAIKEQFKYTSAESITSVMMARYFEVDEVVVGKALQADVDAETLLDIWTSIVLAYVPPEQIRSMGVPSYGYTYRLKGYPLVEEMYWDKPAKSHIHPVTDERSAELTGMDAGYLIQQPLTP